MWSYNNTNELYHFGIKGQKWGLRRYQNEDGSLTSEGMQRYGVSSRKDGPLTNAMGRQLHRLDAVKGYGIKGISKKIRYSRESLKHPFTTRSRYAIANNAGLSETQKAARRTLKSQTALDAAVNNARLSGAMARDRVRIYNNNTKGGAAMHLIGQLGLSAAMSAAATGISVGKYALGNIADELLGSYGSELTMRGADIVSGMLAIGSGVQGAKAVGTAYGMATAAVKDHKRKK